MCKEHIKKLHNFPNFKTKLFYFLDFRFFVYEHDVNKKLRCDIDMITSYFLYRV